MKATGYHEDDRDATICLNDQNVSVYEFLVSAWTYPEKIRYRIIRQRHEQKDDLAYVPETARILVAMAQAAAELIDSNGDSPPISDDIRRMISWFEGQAASGIERAIALRRGSEGGKS